MDGDPELVRVGRVIKPHGLRGELVIAPLGETLGSLLPSALLWIDRPDPYRVESVRSHQGRLLVMLDGCEDRDVAERLRGAEVQAERALLAELPDDEWYIDDLVGYRVEDAAGGGAGHVTAVVEGAHDMLELAWDGEAVLVPMVRQWLISADPDTRCMVVRLPEGLLEANGLKRQA
ncbi:MAG TPA: ribosome maturation factor RimM [Acidobacteriota bacterium]|nr:ribosome maturation factor RimM [Acidobacteriota bacterium]